MLAKLCDGEIFGIYNAALLQQQNFTGLVFDYYCLMRVYK